MSTTTQAVAQDKPAANAKFADKPAASATKAAGGNCPHCGQDMGESSSCPACGKAYDDKTAKVAAEAPVPAGTHELTLTRNVMVPSFFVKLANLKGVTPTDEADARQLMLGADKVAYAVKMTYANLFSPRARFKAALDATGATAPAAPQAQPAADLNAAAFLVDPAVKAAAEALARPRG